MSRDYNDRPRLVNHNIENSLEDLILTGLIISKEFMEGVEHVINPKFFLSPHIKQVAYWVLEYWKEQHNVPKESIQEIFITECKYDTVQDQDLIKILLSGIFEKYQGREFNSKFMIPKTLDYIRERSIALTIEESQWLLKRKGAEDAEKRILEHDEVVEKTSDIRNSSWVRNFEENLDSWWHKTENPAMSFSGDLGKYLHPLLSGKLIAFLAPPKSAKSWHLLHTAYTALTQRKNVLFFSLEMDTEEVSERLTNMLLGQEKTSDGASQEYEIPCFDCKLNQLGECKRRDCPNPGYVVCDGKTVPEYEMFQDHVPCVACRGTDNHKLYKPTTWVKKENKKSLTHTETKKRMVGIKRHLGLDNLKILSYGIGTCSIKKIESILDELEQREGWLPDVLCIDYADLIKPDTSIKDKRNQLGNIWENLSRIAKTRNTLVFTASQANRAAVNKSKLTSEDIAEDFSKAMVADAMISILFDEDYKSPTLKDSYWKRHSLQLIFSRYHKNFKPWQKCRVLHNFSIGQPVIESQMI